MNQSPFKFLDHYEKEDVDQFFGRQIETKLLFKKTFESNLILLYGLSGTGKTSLTRCGLSNMFADTDWLPLFVRRTSHILRDLESTIYEAAYEKEPLRGQPIRGQLRSLYLDYYKPIYLIFDQFEELFILGEKEEADKFFWMVAELLRTDLQIKILLIMREEYIANLDTYERVIPMLFDNRFRVERMRREDIQEVILKSADRFEIEIPQSEDSLTAKIIHNIQNEKGQIDLANLQVYLDRLYRDDLRRRKNEDRSIRFDRELVQQTGQLDDVLARFLDEQLHQLDRELQQRGLKEAELPLKILALLVTNEETKQPQSIRNIIDYLSDTSDISTEHIMYCIHQLREKRIIRFLEKH